MTEKQITDMNEYYIRKYGKPESENDAIKKLCSIYKDLFGEEPTQEIKEGIAEYYRILVGRDLPAFSWILEALHVTSKKDASKKNFPYVVGMLRTWMKYGFGHIPNQEEEDLVEHFKEITGQEMSYQARRVLRNLMGKYGCVKVAIMLSELKTGLDLSLFYMNKLQEICDANLTENKGEIHKPFTG